MISAALNSLLDALLTLAIEELMRRFPSLPQGKLHMYARTMVIIAVQFSDPIQREAEFRALYARIQSVLDGGEEL